MTKARYSVFASIVSVILLLAGSYVWVTLQERHQAPHAPAKPTVSVIRVVTSAYQPTLTAIGVLQANQGTVLKAQTDGQVAQILFSAGQSVHVGDLLVRLNNTQQQGALNAAIAQQKLNKLTYQRDLELKKLGALSSAALDQAQESVEAGDAAIQQAQGAYNLTLVTAPFAGQLGIEKIHLGDYLSSGTDIVSLQNIDPMYIDFYVPEKYFSAIHVGEKVAMIARTAPEKKFIGQVISYETIVDKTTGMLQIRAAIANPHGELLPGGYASIILDMGSKKSSIRVPQTAILYDTQGAYVYRVINQHAARQSVSVGEQVGQQIIVTSGLQAGDVVVCAGTNKVQDKAVLNVVTDIGGA